MLIFPILSLQGPTQVYLISRIALWISDRSSDSLFSGKGRNKYQDCPGFNQLNASPFSRLKYHLPPYWRPCWSAQKIFLQQWIPPPDCTQTEYVHITSTAGTMSWKKEWTRCCQIHRLSLSKTLISHSRAILSRATLNKRKQLIWLLFDAPQPNNSGTQKVQKKSFCPQKDLTIRCAQVMDAHK